MNAGPSVVLLAGHGESTEVFARFLSRRFPLRAVVVEEPVPRALFLKRRVKALGLPKVIGQLAFQAIALPWLRRAARARATEIKSGPGMESGSLDPALLHRVGSVNAPEARELLARLSPTVVVINGTRIVSEATLGCVPARFVNIHAGITPLYRGVHGGYWALAQGRRDACGVTVHLVDKGIDTGAILGQSRIEPCERDNFTTYPLLQLKAGLDILGRILPGLLAGDPPKPLSAPAGDSRLWSHPTLSEYLAVRARLGIK